MSFSVGQAKLILDVDAQPLIEGEAVAWKATRQGAQAVSAFLANENNVRVSDVKKAASIIIEENKKAARAIIQEEKKLSAERKANTKIISDNIKAEYKREEADRKARARSIVESEKIIERERLAEVRRNLQQEATLRRQANERRRDEARKAAEEEKRSSSSGLFGTGSTAKQFGAGAATLLGFGAIASGLVIVRAAMVGLVDATLKQDMANRALNASFGKQAEIYKDLASQYSKQFRLVNSEVDKSIASFGTLNRQSNLTSTQIKSLIPVAIDLQAAYGGDLQEAFRSVSAALLGETEALEKYGIVLQDSVLKTLPQLTEEEKKRFTTMSESEKQLIRFRVLTDLAKDSQGAATQRAKEAQGGFNDFTNATDKLALALGKQLVPALGRTASGLAVVIDSMAKSTDASDKWINALREARAEIYKEEGVKEPGFFGEVANFFNGSRFTRDPEKIAQAERIVQRARAKVQDDAVKEARAKQKLADTQYIGDLQKGENQRTDVLNTAIRQRGEQTVKALQEFADKEARILDQRIEGARILLKQDLEALEVKKKAELEALEETEYQRKRASEEELIRIQNSKKEALRVLDDNKDAELEAIAAEKAAYNDAADERIRIAERRRDKLLEIVEVEKDNAVRAVENERKAVLAVRLQEDRTIDDQLKREDRARDALHHRNMRRYEREADKLRSSSEKSERRIEKLVEAEEERHLKAVRRIDDSADKKLEAIDKEVKALDRAERLEDDRRKRRELNQRRAGAQTTLTRALGSQNPAEIAGARDKLTQAIRIGDPEAVRKAQEELIDISGKGRDAIAAAQQDLANIEEDLLAENVKQAKDAEKEKLDDRNESIRKQVAAEKRQEEDRNRQRKDRLDRDKQANKDRLDDALKKLDKTKEAEKDRYEKDKEGAKDAAETAKRLLEDRRAAEDDKYKNDLERIKLTAEAEIKAIKATYEDEETGLIPNIKRAIDVANKEYEARATIVRKTYEEEREQIEKTYDGLIQQHRRIEEDAQRAYSKILAAKNAHYDAEQKRINEVYKNDNKTGIIDRLEAQKDITAEKLKDDLLEWEKWKDGLVGAQGVYPRTFKEALELFDKFRDEVKKRGGLTVSPINIVNVPVPSFSGDSSDSDASRSPNGGNMAIPPLRNKPQSGVSIPDPNTNYAPVVLEAQSNSYWTDKGTHSSPNGGGPAADIFAAIGTAIYSPVRGKLRSFSDRSGGNAAILYGDNSYVYYFAHGNIPFASGQVDMGMQIGEVGDTGSAKGTSPHLHFAIASSDNVIDRQGGKGDIWGDKSYYRIAARDSGYLFKNPTSYMDMITGERGVMAEKAPERLLGSKETRKLETMLQGAARMNTSPISAAPTSVNDFSVLGANLSGMQGSNTVVREGDKMTYYGVAPEDLMQQWRNDQRRQKVLRGGN